MLNMKMYFHFCTAIALSAALLSLNTEARQEKSNGEVLIYFKDGQQIVVRNCGKNFPKIEKYGDCKGVENRVADAAFKAVLFQELRVGEVDRVKPMTKEEINIKLAGTKTFLSQGISAQDKISIDKLFAGLRAQVIDGKVNGPIFKIVNDLVDSRISSIGEDKFLYKVLESNIGDQVIFNALRQFDASKGQCGTAATIEERIKNCAALPNATRKTSSGAIWNLVARYRYPATGKFYEVWQDAQTKLLWGDHFDIRYSHYNTIALGAQCQNIAADSKRCNVIAETACASEEGKRSNGAITEKKFALPTIEEFQEAQKHGMHEVLPNSNGYWYWSSSLNASDPHIARGFYSFNKHSYLYFFYRDFPDSVRCVSR